MSFQDGYPFAGERPSVPSARDAASNYRRLLAALAPRAKRFGSRDPEGAAQEALKRSLENAKSQPAVEYYFSQDPPAGSTPPAWPLDRLFAWLHAVLQNVVREERDRVAYGREVSISVIGSGRPDGNDRLDPADPAPDQLDALLQSELRRIVLDCLPMLDREYQSVLKMRMHGLKYGEIAIRLGVSENTVATWVSRGIRELARCVRGRTERLASLPRGAGP